MDEAVVVGKEEEFTCCVESLVEVESENSACGGRFWSGASFLAFERVSIDDDGAVWGVSTGTSAERVAVAVPATDSFFGNTEGEAVLNPTIADLSKNEIELFLIS